ncbi:trafficking regulator of GLUT4 1-like [Neoarius graeffei]|uniref:trafficking regulator of GLUT4 1-like n=1 Tax=Neoarius graeffei TaxID=443677 RepID=UPI00298D14B3|nr:trafficking regulator of GLUT4 1-like [Neoarius graeffei]
MDPSYTSEKSRMAENPTAYQANMGYPPAQGVAPAHVGYPPAPGYGASPYGAPPYPGQSTVTVQPTLYVTPATHMNPVPDYLCYSIFTMLCCCLPLGIAALVYSITTRDAVMAGNRELAESNSRMSRILNHMALAIGLVVIIIAIIIIIVSVTSVSSMSPYN